MKRANERAAASDYSAKLHSRERSGAPPYLYLLMGSSEIGKTAWMNRLVDDTYGVENTYMLMGVRPVNVEYECLYEVGDGRNSTYIFADIFDESNYRTWYNPRAYQPFHTVFLFFDLTSHVSYIQAKLYLGEIRERARRGIKVILIGTKLDLIEAGETRAVSTAEAQGFADKHSLKYFETSAKTGENVDRSFEYARACCLLGKDVDLPVPTQLVNRPEIPDVEDAEELFQAIIRRDATSLVQFLDEAVSDNDSLMFYYACNPDASALLSQKLDSTEDMFFDSVGSKPYSPKREMAAVIDVASLDVLRNIEEEPNYYLRPSFRLDKCSYFTILQLCAHIGWYDGIAIIIDRLSAEEPSPLLAAPYYISSERHNDAQRGVTGFHLPEEAGTTISQIAASITTAKAQDAFGKSEIPLAIKEDIRKEIKLEAPDDYEHLLPALIAAGMAQPEPFSMTFGFTDGSELVVRSTEDKTVQLDYNEDSNGPGAGAGPGAA